MGKLTNLWAELKITVDPSLREKLQAEINEVERWMVKKGYRDRITVWGRVMPDDFLTRKVPGYPENHGTVYIEDLY